jgi:hypothetical protein
VEFQQGYRLTSRGAEILIAVFMTKCKVTDAICNIKESSNLLVGRRFCIGQQLTLYADNVKGASQRRCDDLSCPAKSVDSDDVGVRRRGV